VAVAVHGRDDVGAGTVGPCTGRHRGALEFPDDQSGEPGRLSATGDWELSIGYRHQFSYKHFGGDVEQTHRVQQGTEVMNKINLEALQLNYQLTDRIGFGLTLPILFASRRSNNSYYTLHSAGISDAAMLGQVWLRNPKHARRGNTGFGFQAPSGNDHVTNNVLTSPTAAAPTNTVVDYSIQPGSGGWGIIFQWQAFKVVGNNVFYTNGNYVATQGGNNGVLRSATALNQPLTPYVAIQDQYLLQAGIAHPVSGIPGLTITFGPRWEGVPAKNLIGDNPGLPPAGLRGLRRARLHLFARGEHDSG
jgi:hypothetical protein